MKPELAEVRRRVRQEAGVFQQGPHLFSRPQQRQALACRHSISSSGFDQLNAAQVGDMIFRYIQIKKVEFVERLNQLLM